MKKDDITLLVAVVIVAATVSYIISNSIFKYNGASNTVPVVQPISSTLPDAYNDPAYKAIFNSKAIDPTELTHIGNQRNTNPFRGAQ